MLHDPVGREPLQPADAHGVELLAHDAALLALFLLAYCGRARRELNHVYEWGLFGICLLPMSLLYNNSESSFLQTGGYLWSTLVFLTVVFSEPCLNTTKS
jgi:hypothetical protein